MVADSAPAVLVDGVWKTFTISKEHVHTLKERVLHPFRQPGHDTIRALHDVSLEVQPGEFFGIVGRNGSGKSTLLKCLAGIYATDRGRIFIDGRMSTFIELGVGFNPDLSAFDNVVINATMLGLSPREARQRFDEVIAFAELEDYVDLKIKNYSSGMLVRLAFAVMIQVDADILLIDEVLAVGDAAFQQKCFDEFNRIQERGATVLLVTHDMGAVQRFCDRALLLEHGHVIEVGDPEEVGQRYLELNFSQEARDRAAGETDQAPRTATAPVAGERRGNGSASIIDCWFEDEAGQRSSHLKVGGRASIAARVRFNEPVVDPLFAFEVTNDQRLSIIQSSNAYQPGVGSFVEGGDAVFRLDFDVVLSPGRYFVSPAVSRSGSGQATMEAVDRAASVVITGTIQTTGVLMLPGHVQVERAPASQEEVAL